MCTRRSWALPRGLGRPVVVRVWRDAARSSLAAPVRRPRMARAGGAGPPAPAWRGGSGQSGRGGRAGRAGAHGGARAAPCRAGASRGPRGRAGRRGERAAVAPPWSRRSLAQATGRSPAPRRRLGGAGGRPPPRGEPVTRSRAPPCVDKVRDLVGRSLSPPARARGLGGDAKRQRQARARPPPVRRMRPGMAERRPHDAPRPGPPALCAARALAPGAGRGQC